MLETIIVPYDKSQETLSQLAAYGQCRCSPVRGSMLIPVHQPGKLQCTFEHEFSGRRQRGLINHFFFFHHVNGRVYIGPSWSGNSSRMHYENTASQWAVLCWETLSLTIHVPPKWLDGDDVPCLNISGLFSLWNLDQLP